MMDIGKLGIDYLGENVGVIILNNSIFFFVVCFEGRFNFC